MLTPLNQQLDQNPMFNPPTFGATPMAPTPPMAAKPAVGNPATPFMQPNANTPTRGIGTQMASLGRGPDTALVHMSQGEVGGLNALAQATGNRGLTINPATGLPEAGILSSLLPMILGAALSPFITPMGAAAVVGAGYGLVKHDLKAGLMAGLSAFGGAGIGGAISGMMGAGSAGVGALTSGASSAASALPSAAETAAQFSPEALTGIASSAAPAAAAAAPAAAGLSALPLQAIPAAQQAAQLSMNVDPMLGDTSVISHSLGALAPTPGAESLISTSVPNAAPAATGLKGAMQGFQGALRQGVPSFVPNAVTTGLGTSGVLSTLSNAMTPDPLQTASGPNTKPNYQGPYLPVQRKIIAQAQERNPTMDSGERQWFDNVNPYPGYTTATGGIPPGYPGGPPSELPVDTPKAKKNWWDFAEGGGVSPPPEVHGFMKNFVAYAKPGQSSLLWAGDGSDDIDPTTGLPRKKPSMATGGVVSLKPGGFVVDARTVSELGNGSSSAGKDLLARHGGKPINQSKGDGVSDSIPAKINGSHGDKAARVARDEVKFSPEAVRRMGGPQKLYAIMHAAKQSRATAARGHDNGLRRALA